MNITKHEHTEMLRCRDYVRKALVDEMQHRAKHDNWEERETVALVVSANDWAFAHRRPSITVADVQCIEHLAMGHSDYTDKIALYVAELVYGLRNRGTDLA